MRVGNGNMFVGLDISSSGLSAQRMRMNVIAQNLANINTTRDENGDINPYRRKQVVFGEGNEMFTQTKTLGVQVEKFIDDESNFRLVFRPGHPDADEEGYVKMPNVDLPVEMVDMIEATRAYEANVTAMETTKNRITGLLRILS